MSIQHQDYCISGNCSIATESFQEFSISDLYKKNKPVNIWSYDLEERRSLIKDIESTFIPGETELWLLASDPNKDRSKCYDFGKGCFARNYLITNGEKRIIFGEGKTGLNFGVGLDFGDLEV